MKEENKVLRYFDAIRPTLRDESPLLITALVLHHGFERGITSWDDVTDALAELIPEQREHWLRVQATFNDHFLEAMTHMFQEEHDHEALDN